MIKTFLFSFALTLGNWFVEFDESNSCLQLKNPNSNIEISGNLSFATNNQQWQIIAPRDAVTNRLAILNNEQEIQGYLSFQHDGNQILTPTLTSPHSQPTSFTLKYSLQPTFLQTDLTGNKENCKL